MVDAAVKFKARLINQRHIAGLFRAHNTEVDQQAATLIQRFWTEYNLKKRDTVAMQWMEWRRLIVSALGDYINVWNGLDCLSLIILWSVLGLVANGSASLVVLDMMVSIATLLLVLRTYEYLAGFEAFAHLIRTIVQILKDTAAFMVVLALLLAGFAIAFYSLFSHSKLLRDSHWDANNTETVDNLDDTTRTYKVLEFEESQTKAEDITTAYGSISLALLSTFRMLFYDLDPSLFFEHDYPVVIFAVFILFSFLAIIVMLNLLIAIMDGSYESISEHAESESLKEKALLILDVIALMPPEEKTLELFPCWLHMLKPKGQGDSMEGASSAFDSTGVRSITRTLQKDTKSLMDNFQKEVLGRMSDQEDETNHAIEQLVKKTNDMQEMMKQQMSLLRELKGIKTGAQTSAP